MRVMWAYALACAPNEKISSECTDLCNVSCTGSGRVPGGDAHARACVHARPALAPTTRHTLAPAHANKSPYIHACAFLRMHTAPVNSACSTCIRSTWRTRCSDSGLRRGQRSLAPGSAAVLHETRMQSAICSSGHNATTRDRNAPRQAEWSCREREGPTKVARTATKTRFQH